MKNKYFIILFIIISIFSICFAACAVLQHDHNYQVINEVEASCTQDGYVTYECVECGDSYTQTIEAFGHNYVVQKTTATCEDDEVNVYTCTVCGDAYSESVPDTALGHDYKTLESVPATCTKVGYITKQCARCGDENTETLPVTAHIYRETITGATCTDNEVYVYTCTMCGDTYSESVPDTALGHDYEILKSVTATCTEDGYITKQCTRCNDKQTYIVEAKGHSYTEKIIEATCLEDEVRIFTCSVCNDSYSQTVPNTATGHNYHVLQSIAATCTQNGYAFYVCSRCLDSYSTETEALGHNWVLTEATQPTYTLDGAYSYSCTRCEEHRTEIIPKLNYELAINYYYGFADDYLITPVNTQDKTSHAPVFVQDNMLCNLSEVAYLISETGAASSRFEETISLSEFYTHNILSNKQAITVNGKVYNVSGGFKVAFTLNTAYGKFPEDKKSGYADYLSNFDNIDYLRIVAHHQSEDNYLSLYQVIDFSETYIEISKLIDGEYIVVGTIDSASEWMSVLDMDEIVFSDKNGQMFFDAGTYRVMFKYSTSWFLESSSGQLYRLGANNERVRCYPYGFMNDQYDYFYINVTGDPYNVILPDDLNESQDMFYQFSFGEAEQAQAFFKSGDTINVGERLNMTFDTKLNQIDGKYYYDGRELVEWTMVFSKYNLAADAYLPIDSYDLLALIVDNGVSIIEQKNFNSTGDCKFEVYYSFHDPLTGNIVTNTDIYYLNIQ